jgi:hypothetical protein
MLADVAKSVTVSDWHNKWKTVIHNQITKLVLYYTSTPPPQKDNIWELPYFPSVQVRESVCGVV